MFGLFKARRETKFLPEGPWLDRPDALDLAQASSVPEAMKRAARDLITDGFTVLPGAISPDLCQQAIEDYHRYARENADTFAQGLDEHGRERRLICFHQWSDASMKIATNPGVMALLDYLFGQRACAYSSLTFKYGTQQPIHRDTPHFITWPNDQFVGVWTALEDIHEDAGPLCYMKGAHRFKVDQHDIFRKVRQDHPQMPEADQLALALDFYNGAVISESPRHGEWTLAPRLKRGDVAIWHAELPHGGSPAKDPNRARWSMVTHCTPEAVQGYEYGQFFTHEGSKPLPPRYGYRQAYGRTVACIGGPVFG